MSNQYSAESNSKDISLLSDSVEKTLIGLLTKSYSLAKSEINSAKGIVSSAAGSSLEGYVNYTFKQFPENETFENMPGVQVFLRILLGLAGIERPGKAISSDGLGNGKARANYVFKFDDFENYSFGGGLLALLVYNAVVAIKNVQKYTLVAPLTYADVEELDRKSSEVRNKLEPFKDKYGK